MKKKLDKFIIYLEKELNYSVNTIKGYNIDLIHFNEYLIENKINYLKLTKEDVRSYLKFLDNINLSNKSIARKITSLRMFYAFLVSEHIISKNIFEGIKNPKIEKKLPHYLNYEEIEKLLDGIDLNTPLGVRNRLILELFYSTGIRLSEIANIKLNDINESINNIRIFGKGSKERFVYYGDYVSKYLKLYLNTSRNILTKNNNEYLLVNKDGNKLSTSGIGKIVKTCADKICLKNNISPHTLRHTFATHMLNNGADIKTVQELLGHESLSTTEIYTHVSNDRIKEVYLKTHPREKY